MKRLALVLTVFLLLFLSSCNSVDTFIKEENKIIAPDGTEYIFLANEGKVVTFGSSNFLGKIKGEKAYFTHLSTKIKTGLFSCENDLDKRNLVRSIPDSEWKAYYRQVDLPELDLSPNNCVRFELVRGSGYEVDIKHMTCNEGIVKPDEIKAFLEDVRSKKTAEEAGLYDLVRRPDGFLENCYLYGSVYGYFKDEPNLAVPFVVTSFNDMAYSIRMDGGKEYVLPEKWFIELQKSNGE